MTTEQNKLADDGTFTSYADLPEGVRKHLLDLEVFIGEVDGKETVITLSDETCVDNGTLDSSDAVVAFNGIVAALRAAGEPVAFVPLSKAERTKGSPVWNETRPAGAPDAWVGYDLMPLYAAQPAPSASVREALAPLVNAMAGVPAGYVDGRPFKHVPNDIRSPGSVTTISYGQVRALIAALSSTPFPLMAAGEAAPGGAIRELAAACQARAEERDEARGNFLLEKCHDAERRDKIAELLGISGADRDWSLLLTRLNECLTTLRDRAPSLTPSSARASEMVEATSPAKRDYAARVMGDAPELTADFTKSLAGGTLDDSTFSAIEDALDAIDAPMTDGNRYMTLVERITALKQAMAESTREEIAAIIERHIPHDEALNMAAAILALKPRGEPAREGGV